MRLPNGYGSVVKLSGNRRKPFMVRKTIGYKESGTPIYKIIGYCATREIALQELARFNNMPQPRVVATFDSIYHEWLSSHKNCIAKSSYKNYLSAYNHCATIKGKPIDTIKHHELQALLDTVRAKGLSYATAKKVKTLLNQVFRYAFICDVISKNPCIALKTAPKNVPFCSFYRVYYLLITKQNKR